MIKIIDGDLLTATEDYICHQVNMQGVMGSGVAKAISDKWPNVKSAYLAECSNAKDNNQPLFGAVQFVPISDERYVLNIFGQCHYGRDKDTVYTDYGSLASAFQSINKHCAGRSLAFPYMFGCGLANGNWGVVYGLMKDYLGDVDVTIYKKES